MFIVTIGIQERCRVQIQIPQVPDADDATVRTLSIGGDSKESVDAAQIEIYNTLQNQQMQAQNAYNASTTFVVVPDDKVGIIIGKQGATVKDIQNRLRVKIQIPQVPDLGSNPPVRTLR
jgi:far upstream element-binding protein